MSQREVVVLSAVRSAIGTFGGSLSGIEPPELAGTVMKEAVGRSGVDPKLINYVTVGNTIPTESRFPYVARVAAIQAGLPMDSVAMGRIACRHVSCPPEGSQSSVTAKTSTSTSASTKEGIVKPKIDIMITPRSAMESRCSAA